MTIFETEADLAPGEVLARAKAFFPHAGTPYAACPESVNGGGYVRLKLEVGEIVIGAYEEAGRTRVRGSASRGAHLLGQFFTALGPPERIRMSAHRA